jgi:hypothetical protein
MKIETGKLASEMRQDLIGSVIDHTEVGGAFGAVEGNRPIFSGGNADYKIKQSLPTFTSRAVGNTPEERVAYRTRESQKRRRKEQLVKMAK